jgi:hypothetical protein
MTEQLTLAIGEGGQQQAPVPVQRLYPRFAYDSDRQHDIARCERGQSPILGARCPCAGTLSGRNRGRGYAFFAALPPDDLHSFGQPGLLRLPLRGRIGVEGALRATGA